MTLNGRHIPRNSFNFISRICEQKEPTISHNLIPCFRKQGCEKLMELAFLIKLKIAKLFQIKMVMIFWFILMITILAIIKIKFGIKLIVIASNNIG